MCLISVLESVSCKIGRTEVNGCFCVFLYINPAGFPLKREDGRGVEFVGHPLRSSITLGNRLCNTAVRGAVQRFPYGIGGGRFATIPLVIDGA